MNHWIDLNYDINDPYFGQLSRVRCGLQRTLFSLMKVQHLQAAAEAQRTHDGWRTFVDKLYDLLQESKEVDRGIFCLAKICPDVDPVHKTMVWQNARVIRNNRYCGRSLLYVPERLQKERNEKVSQGRNRCISESEMNSREWFPMTD